MLTTTGDSTVKYGENGRGVPGEDGLLLYCRVTTSLAQSLRCDCAAGFATADGNKTKMADGEEGAGGSRDARAET